jgi:adenylyltransferase/sulfurtransferase
MSQIDEVFQIMRKYWRIILKWFLGIHGYPEITVDELKHKLDNGEKPLMIDVRSYVHYNGTGDSKYGHIPGAVSIPMLELESKQDELAEYKDIEIITICPGGGLSLAAVDLLQEAGFNDVKSLKGGTDTWHKKGYPMIRDESI